MNPIRLPHAKSFLLASASALALTIAAPGAAYAFGPLSEHVMAGGASGPAPNPTSPIPGLPAAVSTQAQAQVAQAQTTANLATAAARLQAALTAQANSRNAALAGANNLGADPTHPGQQLPNVPDGLAAGGLNPDSGLAASGTANPVITWVGANTPTQAAANGQTTVNIAQTQAQALLNWQTFNVGKKTTVNFVQKDSTGADQTGWVALNKVNDPAVLPSQILGQINAPGSVYLINHNGVIFGGSSQINVHSLVAAAADIQVGVDVNGNLTGQFATNGIYSTQTNGSYNPSFTNAGGNITVQAGAQINTAAPASITAGGGSVILLGQNVENDGAITTPIGQTVLAAGDNFILRPGYSSDGSNPNSTTNGSEIATVVLSSGNWIPGGTGIVTNNGYVFSQQGDITLVGHIVNQTGSLISTTSVATRGTIHLLNSTSDAMGVVTIASGALTDVMPELDSTDTALNAQRLALGAAPTIDPTEGASPQFDDLSSPLGDKRYQSRIDIVTGGTAEFQDTSLTLANAGQINVAAQKRVQVDNGALLDVSGVDVVLPTSANVLTVNIQGNEERDDPNNRDDGLLFNEDVYVDDRDLILVPGDPTNPNAYPTDRYYTPGGLLEVSGELANVGHTEGEWASSGGSISLTSDITAGSIVAQSGANFNLEGGSIAYQGGRVPTTWLRASDGSIVNINQASVDQTYVGLANSFQVDHTRWVATDNYSSGLLGGSSIYQPGYVVGRDAGSLLIASPTVLFNSNIDAAVVAGSQQTGARPSSAIDPFLESQTTMPIAASLSISPVPNFNLFPTYVGSQVDIGTASSDADSLTITDPLPSSALNTTQLNAATINGYGLGGLNVASSLPVAVDAPVILAPGGQLNLHGSSVDINANLTAHGGAITAIADGGASPIISVAPNVTVDTTGIWTNALQNPGALGGMAFLDGGSISFTSSGDLIVGQGSLLDASSGAAILANGTQIGGNGGNISLLADMVPLNDNFVGGAIPLGPNGLVLGGTVRSYGATKGGSLTLQGGTVVIGDDSNLASGVLAANTAAPDNLVISATLPAGTVVPVNTQLAQPTTFSAGTVVPAGTLSGAWVPLSIGQSISAGISFNSTLVGPGGSFQVSAVPTVSATKPVTTAAPWVVPVGAGTVTTQSNGTFASGATVPAGAVIIGISGTIPAGTVVPASIFPNGLPVPNYSVNIAAGTTLTTALAVPGVFWPTGVALPNAVTVASGAQWPADLALPATASLVVDTILQKGQTFPTDVSIAPFLNLSPAFFQQGFSNYAINGVSGLTVADDTIINAETPVLRFNASSIAAPTGTKPEDALQLWLPPTYLADPTKATLTQRGGVALTLTTSSQNSLQTNSAPLSIGTGSVLSVDPGQSITVSGQDEIDVEGALNAPGGSISVINPAVLQSAHEYIDGTDPTLSIWIGNTATLNVAAEAVTATDQFGRSFGIAPDGGTITLGSAYGPRDSRGVLQSSLSSIVIRPGAVLDASGTEATVDLSAGLNALAISNPVLDASNGGSINLSSYNGLYIDGTMRAFAGGSGAAGGTLSLVLENPIYNATIQSDASRQLRVLEVDADYTPSGIADTATPGSADPALVLGSAHIAQQQIQAGGFDNLLLHGGDSTAFDGNVNLSLGQSLTIEDGRISLASATPDANVVLSAPYVLLTGDIGQEANPDTAFKYITKSTTQATQTGTLSINSNLIDIQDDVSFGLLASIAQTTGPSVTTDLPAFADVSLTSQGDIRFLAANNPLQVNSSLGFTSLTSVGNIDLTAARIYPETDAIAYIIAGIPTAGTTINPDGKLTIARVGSGDVAAPDSVFGQLFLFASQINQGGVVQAPLGGLTIGVDDGEELTAFGINSNGTLAINAPTDGTQSVNFLAGSITSVSAAGLMIPYGGTADNITYDYNGQPVQFINPFDLLDGGNIAGSFVNPGSVTTSPVAGILVGSHSVNIEQGALLDLSGGGDLTGVGFISGRGGSIDVLRNPLVAANPTNTFSASTDKVYAIVPSYSGNYAPVEPDAGAGNPATGQQITIGNGVPGLAAGIYTLLPSTFATLPGAYRIEISAAAPKSLGTGQLPDGTYRETGNLSVAGTAQNNSVPEQVLITPGTIVRDYSQYNEASYSDFARAQSALLGSELALLPIDAKWLSFDFGGGPSALPPLSVQGTIDLAPANDGDNTGRTGMVSVFMPSFVGTTPVTTILEIRGPGEDPTPGTLSIAAADLEGFGGGGVVLGGYETEGELFTNHAPNSVISMTSGAGVTVNSGAVLLAPMIFVSGDAIINNGAVLSTLGKGAPSWDSMTDNLLLSFGGVALSNGNLIASASAGSGAIASGATLLSEGTILLAGGTDFTIGDAPIIGTKNLVIGGTSINVGSADALAAAASVLPTGWSLNQNVLDALLNPVSTGAPALQDLTLIGSNSVNFIGSVDLNTLDPVTGKARVSLTLETPAVYGLGSSSDVASISTDTFTWTGITNVSVNGSTGIPTITVTPPGAVAAGGPGTGTGSLQINANNIILGYPALTLQQNVDSVDRLALGFSNVTLNASQSISANNTGTLSVYQSGPSPAAFDPAGYAGTGGSLILTTPLLTTSSGAKIGFYTGGAFKIAAPASGIGDVSKVTTQGGEIDIEAGSVGINSAIALPTGKLSVLAANDIALGADSNIDLSGRTTTIMDATSYSWGGDANFESTSGNINQDAASIINVSAQNNTAGSIDFTATSSGAGVVDLEGQLLGSATGPNLSGSVDVQANSLSNFADINSRLDIGGVYGNRTFSINTGDLVIDNLKANTIDISLNGGSLTVNGTLDASGASPGTIRLSAKDDLTLAGSSILDAHGSVLQTDNTGAAIDAENRAHVELTSSTGTMTLSPGAIIDVSSPEAVQQGDIELNVSRGTPGIASSATDETTGDAKIVASGPLTIKGAHTIAVNAFWTYVPTDANGSIIQDNLDPAVDPVAQSGADVGSVGLNQINVRNAAFYDAAIANSALQNRLSGLSAYSDAFHLRPGVEIDSATPTGNLNTVGDLDFAGFRYGPTADTGPSSPGYGAGEVGDIVIRAGGNLNINGSVSDGFAQAPLTLDGHNVTTTTTIPTIDILSGVAIPTDVTFLTLPTPDASIGESYYLSPNGVSYFLFGKATTRPTITCAAGFATCGIDDPIFGHQGSGKLIDFSVGSTIEAGTILTSPKITAGDQFLFIPGGSTSVTSFQVVPVEAAAPMLAPGSQSWSMRFVAGANLDAADTRTVQPKSILAASGDTGDVVLSNNVINKTDTLSNQDFSVVRTGTGSLDLIAGGNFTQNSLYGVYTAGTQASDVTANYELGLGTQDDGTVLGAANTSYNAADANYHAYYPTGGGDVLLSAQGDITGYYSTVSNTLPGRPVAVSNAIGNWLWRQGGVGSDSTAWSVNFGSYVDLKGADGQDLDIAFTSTPIIGLVGFEGVGTLGGGNLTVIAGRNAGVLTGYDGGKSTALDLFVGSTGRVGADGTVEQTGGGSLNVTIGGSLNPQATLPVGDNTNDAWGIIGDTRGNITIKAGSVGQILQNYSTVQADDPRAADPFTASEITPFGGIILAPGDSSVTMQTRGDQVLGTVADPGRAPLQNSTDGSYSWFTLWQPDTAVHLISAGGNIVPETAKYGSGSDSGEPEIDGGVTDHGDFLYPPILTVLTPSGSIYAGYSPELDSDVSSKGVIELAPSPISELSFIAGDSINDNALAVGGSLPMVWALSGADSSIEATPQNPGTASNFWDGVGYLNLFNFGPDTAATKSIRAADAPPAIFYARTGDIYDLRYGDITQGFDALSGGVNLPTVYIGDAPIDAQAGRDIVNFGAPFNLPLFTSGYFDGQAAGGKGADIASFILNNNPTDISIISAGRDVLYANAVVAGPGALEVTAGRNIYQGDHGLLESIGSIVSTGSSDRSGGASVTLMPGVGASGPDLTDFADLYFNGANQADPSVPLDFPQNQGKVVKTYQDDLFTWLQQRFGFAGSESGALAYFLALPKDQQLLFDLKVYFEELDASDVEFNTPSDPLFQSYVRGKQAIAELFPAKDVNGNAIGYSGSLTLASGNEIIDSATPTIWDSGIHTEFGGDINVLTPGGTATLGAEGIAPGASTGLLTEGSGNINIYAENSIPLGLSRVFTTFGGDITMWSATGDINAGRGAKGTVVFTPVRRTYDQFGNVALAPTVPSQGAGIATLAPIPGIPPGDVYLVAPEGIIDAGEAGIRVSGNAFLAALQVVNAANIQVKGQAFGLPPKPVTNLSFTTASTAATEAANIVRQMATHRESVITVDVTGFGGDFGQPSLCVPTATNSCN